MLLRSPNTAPLTRLRLHFNESDFALGPQQRVLFLCPAQALLVADICAAVVDRFIDADDARVALQTPDGFLVPSHESVSILRDNDELVVVRCETKSKKQKRKHRESESTVSHVPEVTSTSEMFTQPEIPADLNTYPQSPPAVVRNPVLNPEVHSSPLNTLNPTLASPMETTHQSDSLSAATTESSSSSVHQISSTTSVAIQKSQKIKASKPTQSNSQSKSSTVPVQPKPAAKPTILTSASSFDQLPAFIGSQVDVSKLSSIAVGTVVLYRVLELNNFIPSVSDRRLGRVISTEPLSFALPTSKTSQHLSSFLNSSQTGPRVFRAMHASAFDSSSAVTFESSDITELIAVLNPKGHLICNEATDVTSIVQPTKVDANSSVHRDPIPIPSVIPDVSSSSTHSQTSSAPNSTSMEVDSELSAELALRRQMLQTRAALYAKRRESRFSGPAFGSVSSQVIPTTQPNHVESTAAVTPAIVEAASVSAVHTGLTVQQRRAARRQRQRQHKQANAVV